MRNMMLPAKNCKILLLAALFVGAASTAFAGTTCGTNLEYELQGTMLVLTSPDPGASATISSSAFYNRTDFTDVIIPDNVTSIGPSAFYGCSSLTHVLCRPQMAPALGADAFTSCATGLQICVPTLGAYRNEDIWIDYQDYLTLCFLDENDEQAATAGKIS